MRSGKKLNTISRDFRENINKEFSGIRDRRVDRIIGDHFSLSRFENDGITFEQSQLERDAAAGDAFSLVMLEKFLMIMVMLHELLPILMQQQKKEIGF